MHIDYSEQSIEDLDSIIAYIAQDSLDRATDYIEKIKSKIELLLHSPKLGIECKYKNIRRACRVYIVDSYLVFYTIENYTISIKRVLHSSVDYADKLENE